MPQSVDWSISVRRGLEIGHKMVTFVSQLKTPNALIDLRRNRLPRLPSAWAKTTIVTERATTGRHGPVDIRASKATIDADTLDTVPKKLA